MLAPKFVIAGFIFSITIFALDHYLSIFQRSSHKLNELGFNVGSSIPPPSPLSSWQASSSSSHTASHHITLPQMPPLDADEKEKEKVGGGGGGDEKEIQRQPKVLILYSYYETPGAKRNLEFFLQHALHSTSDFVFLLNQDAASRSTVQFPHPLPPNIRIVERSNTCFDLGGFHEVLTATLPGLRTRYARFILLNSSLRGPFFPAWALALGGGVAAAAPPHCWADAILAKLNHRTKLVGLTWNCANGIPYEAHVQSMLLAVDATGLAILLSHLKCYGEMIEAVAEGETKIASWIRDYDGEGEEAEAEGYGGGDEGGLGHGDADASTIITDRTEAKAPRRGFKGMYDVATMESRFAAHAGPNGDNSTAFLEWCTGHGNGGGEDVLHSDKYEDGTTIHPYETIFAKTNRDWNDHDTRTIELLTKHAELQNYSSYDACG